LSNPAGESSVANPDPGSDTFLTPGSRIEKIQTGDMGSGMNTPDLIFELKILQIFDADPEPGSCQPWIWDPGWKISDPGYGNNKAFNETKDSSVRFCRIFNDQPCSFIM
jgi:hypothetical protein